MSEGSKNFGKPTPGLMDEVRQHARETRWPHLEVFKLAQVEQFALRVRSGKYGDAEEMKQFIQSPECKLPPLFEDTIHHVKKAEEAMQRGDTAKACEFLASAANMASIAFTKVKFLEATKSAQYTPPEDMPDCPHCGPAKKHVGRHIIASQSWYVCPSCGLHMLPKSMQTGHDFREMNTKNHTLTADMEVKNHTLTADSKGKFKPYSCDKCGIKMRHYDSGEMVLLIGTETGKSCNGNAWQISKDEEVTT